MPEVEPDVPGDVREVDAAEAGADDRCRPRRGGEVVGRLAARADDQVAAVLELELERLLERSGVADRRRDRAGEPA